MTTLSIQPPFPLITDIDGQPLEDGYIWIGTANLPPIGNPIAVYWDAALTIPAALPIRTRGGYPVNAGTPARLYVNSDYSILVQNKNGSMVYSAPVATERYGGDVISTINASQVVYDPAGLGAVATTVQAKLRETVSVLDFGADPTGSVDSTGAIQDAMDFFAANDRVGGTVYFPHGKYLVQGTLVPKSENIRLIGDGKRNPQTDLVESDTDVPATLFKTGTGALIRIDTQYRCNGFRTRGITLLGAVADKANITGVEWFINGPSFRRDFAFEETTVSRFNDAFLVNRDASATESAVGVIRIILCSVMKNEYIWRHTGSTSQVNGFVFEKCDAGQNGYSTGGGIYGLRAQNITIADNILEGQRDAIRITGGFRGIRIQNNYFEANVGEACVNLQDTEQGIVGPNTYVGVLTDYKVRMLRCVGFTVLDPAWQEGSVLCFDGQYTSSSLLSSGGEYIITAPTGVVLPWRKLDKASFARINKPSSYVIGGFLPGTICREKWIDGTVVAAGETAATSGYLFSETFTLSAVADQFLVVSYALRFTDETGNIYAALRVNGSGSSVNGSWSTSFTNSRISPTGEWVIVTFACRALVTVTSLEVYLYPFGLSHTGTKTFRGLRGVAYVCDDPSQIRPFVDIDDATQVFAPPTTGTWVRGDKLWDVTPTAGAAPGWVCTTAGTPGTWKAMANLAV